MKTIIKYGSLWLLPLAIYIFEIVWVCIKGATLVNSICAWASCIVLLLQIAIPSVARLYKSEKKLKETEKEFCRLLDKHSQKVEWGIYKPKDKSE